MPRIKITRRSAALASLLALASCATVTEPQRPSRSRVGKTAVQALIGATDYHKLTYTRTDPGSPNTSAEADLSTMPALGIAGQYAIAGSKLEVGLDGGLLFSWDTDQATYVSTGPGSGVVLVDRGLLVVDLFLGPYLSTTIADRLRLYAAGGASMMYGDASYRDEFTHEDGTAFGVGVYGRAGAEIRLVDRSFLGVGVRWVGTELDFGGAIGTMDVEGWQGFLTYTIGF